MIELGKRLFATLVALKHLRHLDEHGGIDDTRWTLQAMLEEERWSRPSIGQKEFGAALWQSCPDRVVGLPLLLLKQGRKWILVKPQRLKIRVVNWVMFDASNTLQLFTV
jgi:hypothetical protein